MGLIRKALSIATVGLSDRLFEDDSKRGRTAKSKATRGRTQKQRKVTRSKPRARPKPKARPKAAPRRKPRARPEPVSAEPQALRTSAPAASSALAPGESTINELERLADLHSRGALTSEEFAVAKAKILGTSPTPREPARDDAAFPAVEANVAAARRLADLAALDDASVTTLSSD